MLLAACGGEPPAVEVGPVGFSAEELGVLGPGQRQELARLTAFGLAIAADRVDELIAPTVRRDVRSVILQNLALELAADSAGIAEGDLRRFYLRDPRHELLVRHLVVLSERWRPPAHRDSARAVAEAALERIEAGESFEEVAAEVSDEPGAAERGGLLRPGREGSWVPEFWAAASSLTEGEVSDVVETEFGFHVIRLEERRVIPFEEVRGAVLRQVMSLPPALGRAASWATERVRAATVDSAALTAWRREGSTTMPLVRWPDGLDIPPLTGEALSEYVRSLPPETRPAGSPGPEEARQLLDSAARRHVMLVEARARGIAVSAPQETVIRGRWSTRIEEWARALGFAADVSHEEVKARALRALGSEQQSAAMARSELDAIEPTLLRLYPVTRREDERRGTGAD